MLDIAQLPAAASTGSDDAHVEELLQHDIFLLAANGIIGLEFGQAMGELAEGATKAIVFAIVCWFLDSVSAEDGGFTVIVVGFVRVKVYFSKELLLVMLELAHHVDVSCAQFD